MNATPDDRRMHAQETADEPDARRDAPREDDGRRDRDPRNRASRVGAAQLAAPSTRRWRRAGRFDSTS